MDGVMTGPSPGRRSRQFKDTSGRHAAQGKEPTSTSTPIKTSQTRLGENGASVPLASHSRNNVQSPSPKIATKIVAKSQGVAHDSAKSLSTDPTPLPLAILPGHRYCKTKGNTACIRCLKDKLLNQSNVMDARTASLSYSAPVSRKPPQPHPDLSNVRQNLNASLAACDAYTTDKSDAKSLNTTLSNTSLAYLKQPREFENKTIQKQRQELELLIGELRDRDRELNEMVLAHREQMKAWELDRQKILMLEEKNAKLQRDLQLRNDDMRALVAKLRIAENEDQNKATALNSTQEQLSYISEQQSHTSLHLQELEDKNKKLASSVRDMTTAVGQMEAREQELVAVLKLKDRDLSESSSYIAELSAKTKKLDSQFRESKEAEADMRRSVSEWKNKYLDTSREYDHLKRQFSLNEQRSEQDDATMKKLKQDISTLKKEVILANEREKRKDQLLELQRSKQERSDGELASVRQLYERQQRELSLLHLNLESTQELFGKDRTYDSTSRRSPHASPDRELTGHKSRSTSYTARSPTRAYSPNRITSLNRSYHSVAPRGDTARPSIRQYSPTRASEYQTRSYSPTALGSYSPNRSKAYSPGRQRDATYSPSRTYQPTGTRSTTAVENGRVDNGRVENRRVENGRVENGRVEPLFTSSTSPYTAQALASTEYSASPIRANTGAGDSSISTGNAYLTPKRKQTAEEDSHQSTPASSASKHSIGSKRSTGSHHSRPSASNGELDNSLEELTMSRDDQASSHTSPEADKSVASEKSTSTVLTGSQGSLTPRQSHEEHEIQQEEIDNIFSSGQRGDKEGLTSEEILERSTTPLDPGAGDEPGKGLSKTQLVMISSVKETDSPATKLHKLLTESRDMVQELEKSAVVHTQEQQPDISTSEAIPSPSDTDAD